jgi:hypothetical protein
MKQFLVDFVTFLKSCIFSLTFWAMIVLPTILLIFKSIEGAIWFATVTAGIAKRFAENSLPGILNNKSNTMEQGK